VTGPVTHRAHTSLRCPVCVDTIPWPPPMYFEYHEGEHRKLDLPENLAKRADVLRSAWFPCPNPSGDSDPHWLPVALASYQDGLVIGIVGASRSGKSHLLAAMMHEIDKLGLQRYGMSAMPLDAEEHNRYLQSSVHPLTRGGQQLLPTDRDVFGYADSLLVTSAAGTRPVTFFDVAGGNLEQSGRTGRFLAGAGALLFVVNPGTAFGAATADDPSPAGRQVGNDQTFAAVLSRLRHPGSPRHLDIPAAVVLTKADRLRFQSPVDTWLRMPPPTRVDPAQIRAESRDVYAYLRHRDATAWLAPFHECRKCTLHFVSATGGESRGRRYPRGIRPLRVLEPLVALFAMTGVLPGAERVGRE
jgi:hypothetical protein